MARHLFESACLDGLEKLPVDGTLPASFLRYFKKVMDLFDESTRVALRQLRNAGLTLQCQPECPHCCYQMPTGVSIAELIYLYHGINTFIYLKARPAAIAKELFVLSIKLAFAVTVLLSRNCNGSQKEGLESKASLNNDSIPIMLALPPDT